MSESLDAAVEPVTAFSRQEYEQLVRARLAGPVTTLADAPLVPGWRGGGDGWRGRYWALLDDGHGVLRLRPVNVTRTTTAVAETAPGPVELAEAA